MSDFKDMLLEKGKCTFFIKRPMKTTTPGLLLCSQKTLQIGTFALWLQSLITYKLQETYQPLINWLLATRNHARQLPQARLAGGVKLYLGKQELILKNIFNRNTRCTGLIHAVRDWYPLLLSNFRTRHDLYP